MHNENSCRHASILPCERQEKPLIHGNMEIWSKLVKNQSQIVVDKTQLSKTHMFLENSERPCV